MSDGWDNSLTGSGRSPQTGRFVPRSENPYLGRFYARQATQRILSDVRSQIGFNVSEQVYNRLYEGLYTWAKTIGKEEATDSAFEEMHAKLANEIQETIVSAYQKAHGNSRPYRWAETEKKMKRYSNKAMVRALNHPELVQHDARGISFPNTKVLDETARQWYRLNFGAKPASTPTPVWGNMKFGQRPARATNTNVNFNNYKPSKSFMVPQLSPGSGSRGVWSKKYVGSAWGKFQSVSDGYTGAYSPSLGRNSALYLVPKAFSTLGFERKKSKGIVGTRFIDEGARVLNDRYGQEVSKLLDQWRNKANKAGKAVAERKGEFQIATTIEAPKTGNIKAYGAAGSIDFTSPQSFFESGGDAADLTRSQIRAWKSMGLDYNPADWGF